MVLLYMFIIINSATLIINEVHEVHEVNEVNEVNKVNKINEVPQLVFDYY